MLELYGVKDTENGKLISLGDNAAWSKLTKAVEIKDRSEYLSGIKHKVVILNVTVVQELS